MEQSKGIGLFLFNQYALISSEYRIEAGKNSISRKYTFNQYYWLALLKKLWVQNPIFIFDIRKVEYLDRIGGLYKYYLEVLFLQVLFISVIFEKE